MSTPHPPAAPTAEPIPEWNEAGFCWFDCGAHRPGATSDGSEVLAHIVYDHANQNVEHRRCGEACQQHGEHCHWHALAALEREKEGCINCGETNDGGFYTSEGEVGSFCEQCWDMLRDEFAALPVAPPAAER